MAAAEMPPPGAQDVLGGVVVVAGPAGLAAALCLRRFHRRVDRLYAAGDVVSALDQIGVAVGQAAIAATAIRNHLTGLSTTSRR